MRQPCISGTRVACQAQPVAVAFLHTMLCWCCVPCAELSEARRGLVQAGKTLQEGVDNTHSAQQDAQAYLDSVKHSQAELDSLGKGPAARKAVDDTIDQQAASTAQAQQYQPVVVDVDLSELD